MPCKATDNVEMSTCRVQGQMSWIHKSHKRRKKKTSKKVPVQQEKCKTQTQTQGKTKKAKSKQTKNIDTANMDGYGRKKHPMLKMFHRQVKKRRAQAKTNAQTLKQGHYIIQTLNKFCVWVKTLVFFVFLTVLFCTSFYREQKLVYTLVSRFITQILLYNERAKGPQVTLREDYIFVLYIYIHLQTLQIPIKLQGIFSYVHIFFKVLGGSI